MKKKKELLYTIILLLFTFGNVFIEGTTSKEKISLNILNPATAEDPFLALTEEELQREWSSETEDSLLSKITNLQHTFEDYVYIDVKLVGFEGSTIKEVLL